MVLVGQEHINLREHPEGVQKAISNRYRRLDALAVLTERDRLRYRRLLPDRVPVVRIPNTVRDLGDVQADLGAKRILTAGRMGRQKGHDRLIKTWERIAADHPDWELRICGDGPWKGKLERMVEKRGLTGSVTLAPPAKDMGAEMAAASIFVLSSRWEGLPLVLLEAMSVGMGVVSFDCPTGPREVIEDHVNGLLIRPRKIELLAAGLSEMMDDAELRRRCAERAVETARGYSMEAVGPMWESFLREAWERRTAA
jgi:glycosyltransferase involved in cell wall biosynthesis